MPIINPFFFYLCDICNSLKEVGNVFALVGIACLLAVIIGTRIIMAIEQKASFPVMMSLIKGLVITIVICALIGALLPSRNTLYLMKAAELTTYENVEVTGDAAKEIFSYVLNSLQNEAVS